MSRAPHPSLLGAVVASVTHSVRARRELEPLSVLERRCQFRQPQGDRFCSALAQEERLNVIAECKRRSPSRGVLRSDYQPAAIARDYAQAGAAAISVLTEPTFFDGSLLHLEAVRQEVSVPLLRKDFIVDEYQLFEARACGADAVLLIVAALEDRVLEALSRRAQELGLAALVEVHDAAELARALRVSPRIIGVNNRNLETLAVDTQVSKELIDMIPDGVVAVAESGLRTWEDLVGLRAAGYDAFLVGERLVTEAEPGRALAALLGKPPRPVDANAASCAHGGDR